MIDRYKRLSDWFYYFLVLPGIALLPARLGQALVRQQGRHFFKVHKETRARAVHNFLRVFPQATHEEAERTIRKSFEMMASDDLESYYFHFWTRRTVQKFFTFEGLEHLDEAKQEGKGVVLVSGHFGAIASAMVATGQSGYPLHPLGHDSVKDPSLPPPLRSFTRFRFYGLSPKRGIHYLFFLLGQRSEELTRATLQAYRLLKEGERVLMLLDTPPALVDNKRRVRFLGAHCQFPTGPVSLSHMAGARLLPFFALRDERRWWHQTVIFQPPVVLSGNLEEDLQQCTDRLDEMVRRHPAHWFGWDSLQAYEVEGLPEASLPEPMADTEELTL